MANEQQIRTPSGLAYGKAKELADMQRAAPIPKAPGIPAGGPPARDAGYRAPVIPLDAPSTMPGQHVLDGVDIGPGRTAAEAGIPVNDDGSNEAVAAMIRGIYAATGMPELLSLLASLEGTDQDGVGLADPAYAFGQWDNPWKATTRSDNVPDPASDGMFDPGARLDPSQVDDQRIPTAAAAVGRAAIGGLAAAAQGMTPPADEGDTNTVAFPDTPQPITKMGRAN